MELTKDLIKQIKENSRVIDSSTIVIGNLLELHIDEEGENMDIYKYVPQEVMEADEDYDFDADYITSIYLK